MDAAAREDDDMDVLEAIVDVRDIKLAEDEAVKGIGAIESLKISSSLRSSSSWRKLDKASALVLGSDCLVSATGVERQKLPTTLRN